MNRREILVRALEFHGHRCWASTAGVRAGFAALDALGVDRAGSGELLAAVEIGERHGAMCFADGIQYTTGCTLGKGTIGKTHEGKLAVTLTEAATGRSVRVSYRPTLQSEIGASPFMKKRRAGISPSDIPEDEQWELVDLVWEAPAEAIMKIGEVTERSRPDTGEVVAFGVCDVCEELVAEPYLRVVNEAVRCKSCSGYAN
jgi:formylmethanofuran dehydrogenase subunit E